MFFAAVLIATCLGTADLPEVETLNHEEPEYIECQDVDLILDDEEFELTEI